MLPLSTPVAAAALGGLSFTTIALLERDLPVCLTPSRLTAIDFEGVGLGGKVREGVGHVAKLREGAGLVGGEEGNLRVSVLWRQKEMAGTTGP